MIRVWLIPFSTNVERLSLALAHKGAEAEAIEVDPDDRRELVRVSGQELVPVADFDGEIVVDSPVILRKLEELHPDPPLWPADRARRAELDVFIDWFNRVWKVAPNAIAEAIEGGHARPVRDRCARAQRWRAALAVFESLLEGRPYLFGNELSAADCVAFPFLKYAAVRDPADDELFHRVLEDYQQLGDCASEPRRLDRAGERAAARPAVTPPVAAGDSFRSFFDAVDKFFASLAAVHWGSLIIGLLAFFVYLTLRSRAAFNVLRAAYPERDPLARDLGRVLGRLRLQQRHPRARWRRHPAVPHPHGRARLELPAIAAAIAVEAVYDLTIAVVVLRFAFTQGVFPKPPDFSKLNAFDLSYFASHPRFTLFTLTVLAMAGADGRRPVGARTGLLGAGPPGADDPVRPAPLLPRGLADPVRRLAVPLHRVLVPARGVQHRRLGAQRDARAGLPAVSAVVPFTPGGAGVVQALLVTVFAGGERRHRCRLLRRPAGGHRGLLVRDRVHRARDHLPDPQLQGGHPPRPRGPRGGEGPKPNRLGPEALAGFANERDGLGEDPPIAWRSSAACCSAPPWRLIRDRRDGHVDGQLDRVVGPRDLLRALHLLGELRHALRSSSGSPNSPNGSSEDTPQIVQRGGAARNGSAAAG